MANESARCCLPQVWLRLTRVREVADNRSSAHLPSIAEDWLAEIISHYPIGS